MSSDLSIPTTRLAKKTTCPSPADAKKTAELESLRKEVCQQCSTAMQTGKLGKPGSTLSLPVSKTRQLAALVSEAKLANWAARAEKVSTPPPAALLAVAGIGKDLEDMFSALAQCEIPKEASGGNDRVDSVMVANIEAGLQLACVHLDAAAGCGPLPELGESIGDHTVLQFVSHVVRSIFTNKGTPCSMSSLTLPLIGALAAVWQSAHHAIAAAKYAVTPLARRVVPLAARCLAGIPHATSRQGAPEALLAIAAKALDLLAAALGQGEDLLQALAVEELAGGQNPVRASTRSSGGGGESTEDPQPGKGPGRPRRKEKRLSVQTAALIRAVSATCLPARLCDISDTVSPKDLQDKVNVRRSLAEERAATLITGTLRRCLLGAERDSQEWMQLEGLTSELLDHCTDPYWPASPLVLLSLTKGLTAVAGASRSVEMSWTQREFAVRLLGMIAAKLCQECATADLGNNSDLLELRRWSEASRNGGTCGQHQNQVISRHAKVGRCDAVEGEPGLAEEQEVQRLVVQFLEAAPASAKVLWAPVVNERATSAIKTLEHAVLPAEHAVWSSAFLLGSWAAQSCQGSSRTRSSAQRHADKTKSQRTPSKRAVAAFRAEPQEDGTATSWALATWASRASAEEILEVAAQSGRKTACRRDAVKPNAGRLYRQQLLRGTDAELGKARRVALEALLGQLKSSPLVFVRRQAVLGLANACSSDKSLVTSRCMVVAMQLGLSDDSALVRSAVIDFIGRLVSGDAKGLDPQNASQMRAAVRARLGDVAPGVRRAAFRVVCDALCPEDPALMTSAIDLMQRIQHEASRVREPVLSALESVLLAQPLADEVLERLATLSADASIGGAGLRDLFKMHRNARNQEMFSQTMRTLALRGYQHIEGQAATECPTPVATILEQIALEYPVALFPHIKGVQSWLEMTVEKAITREVMLAQHACRIIADVLPAWAIEAHASEKKRVGLSLEKMLTPLLTAETSVLTRGAMECLSMIATHVLADPKTVLKHVGDSFQYLSNTVSSRSALDAAEQRLLCRHAWILGTALEFLDVDELASANDTEKQTFGLPVDTAGNVARILCALCLKGPTTLRHPLTPCLGFVVRRHMKLLQVSPGTLDVFRNGLSNSDGASMRGRTVEVLAGLVMTYQRAVETGTPPGGVQNEAVAKTLLAPKVSEAVQRLATLQPQVLETLAQADAAVIANHAVEVLGSFSQLGVLHPSPALSGLVASSMAGFQEAAGAVSRLIFKLTEASPQLLLSRLGSGLREAAVSLKACAREPGSALREAWRVTALKEVCSEHFEGKRLRESFLGAVLAEVMALGNAPDDSDALLERAELLLALLAGMPYRCEFEVAQLLKCSVQFLTLRTLPLLSEAGTQSASSLHPCSLGICAASLLLHSLCQHLCTPSEIPRLLSEAEADRALPPGFSRRLSSLEVFVPMFRELATAAGDCSMLRGILESHVPLDSALLKGACHTAQQAASRPSTAFGGKRGRGRLRSVTSNGMGEPPRKRQVTEASSRGDGQSNGATASEETVAASAALAGA